MLIVVENLPVPEDKRVWQEARSLSAAGYEVSVLCPKGKGGKGSRASFERLEGISIWRHPLPIEGRGALGFAAEYAIALFWETWLAWRVFFSRRVDAIHACNPPDDLFLVALPFRWLFGTRFLFDQHDGNPELWLAKGGRRGGLGHRLLGWLERRTFRAADVALVVNDHFVGIATGRGGMAPEDVFQVRNAPSRELVERTLERIGQVATQPRAHTLVGYLGVIGKQDGVDNLMQVVHEVVRARGRGDLRFRVMGDGPELPAVRALAARLGIDEHVEFTGWVSGEAYVEGLAGCDLCVNADPPNGYNEICSPNKVYEYMLFAKPIVQFDLPEPRIVAGDCALYAASDDNAALADRILELADDPARRRELGRRARERFLERFTWERSEAALLAAYERLFAKPPRGGGA